MDMMTIDGRLACDTQNTPASLSLHEPQPWINLHDFCI